MLGLAGLHAEAAKACELAGLPLYLVGEPPAGVGLRGRLRELMSSRAAERAGR